MNSTISIILTSISSIAAVLTVFFSYKAIKVNKSIFVQSQKAEEQRLLPLFDIVRDHKTLDETLGYYGRLEYEEATILSIVNLNTSVIANVTLIDSKVFIDNNDTEPLLTSKYLRAYNFGVKGVTIHLVEETIKEKEFKINLTYVIPTNKKYKTEIILSAESVGKGIYFNIKEQNHIKITKQ